MFAFSGRYNGWHVPTVYVLTTDKNQETYDKIFKILLQNAAINPTDFMVDFEMAAINSVRENFPLADVRGCHFHFGQNVWRKIQQLGLQTEYNEDEEFAFNLRLLISLAYVPLDNVMTAYEELIETEFFTSGDARIEALLEYFQATYIYAFDRKGKKRNRCFQRNCGMCMTTYWLVYIFSINILMLL